jgi:hypothetical protein
MNIVRSGFKIVTSFVGGFAIGWIMQPKGILHLFNRFMEFGTALIVILPKRGGH